MKRRCANCGAKGTRGAGVCTSCGSGIPIHPAPDDPITKESVADAPRATGVGPGGQTLASLSGRDPRWLWVVTALGALIALVASVATIVIIRSDRRSTGTVRVTLRPLDQVTPHPFTKSVVTVDPDTARAYAEKVRRRREARSGRDSSAYRSAAGSRTVGLARLDGDRSGLYGTRRTPVCDTAALTAALAADRRTSTVWARLMGIAPSDIGRTVAGLTPVVLAHDTAVTNHIYRDGRGTPLQDILEAGTAVLVDNRGAPRVKCSCGNPLLPPRTSGRQVEVVGDSWDGYDPGRVVTVAPAARPVVTIDATDITTGATTTIAAGGNVALDGLLLVNHDGVHVVSEDGTKRTTVIDHEVARAFDDGAGGLIYNELGPLDERGRPVDPIYDAERDNGQAVIWHLSAGANRAVPLTALDPAGGTWYVAEATGTLAGHRVLVYQKLHPAPCFPGDDLCAAGDLRIRDLDTGDDALVHREARLEGQAPQSVSVDGNRLAYTLYGEGTGWSMHVLDEQLREKAAPCRPSYEDPKSCSQYLALVPDPSTGRPSVFGNSPTYDGDNQSILVDLGSGAHLPKGERQLPPAMQGEAARYPTVDARRGLGLISIAPGDAGTGATVLIDLTEGTSSELSLTGLVRFLRAPLIRPPVPEPERLPTPPADPSELLKRFAAAWAESDDTELQQLVEPEALRILANYRETQSGFEMRGAALTDSAVCLTDEGCTVLQIPDGPGWAMVWSFYMERQSAGLRIVRVVNRGDAG